MSSQTLTQELPGRIKITDKTKKQNNLEGYEYDPEVSGGKYLNLKAKGDTVQIRIVSLPKHTTKHWVMTDSGKNKPINCTKDDACPWCGVDVPPNEKIKRANQTAWIVIDREDGEVKMFKIVSGVYAKIKKQALLKDKQGNEVWGDPMNYDITIERTENPGADYYVIGALPATLNKEITKEEKALVDACDIDLAKELAEEGGKKDDSDGNLETVVPTGDEGGTGPEKKDTNNEDDIPF